MKEVLRYEHVDICYNGHKAVNDVSFSLSQGEILAIVGESGSGKSTLIKAAMGLLGPTGLVTRGDIWYAGLDLPDLPKKERRKICGSGIGMIFQDAGASLCPVRRVGVQIYESMRAHENVAKEDAMRQATDLMEKIGLEDPQRILFSFPFELSGGMQQRVAIAAAMLLQPKVLLADEPTSALDSAVQKQVVREMLLVRELFGTSIIIVTHNIGVARAMADNIMVMKDGAVVEYGASQRILTHPEADYTRRLMRAVPTLKKPYQSTDQQASAQWPLTRGSA